MKKQYGKIVQIAYSDHILILLDSYGNVFKQYVYTASKKIEEITPKREQLDKLTRKEEEMKYKIRTYNLQIFIADILWITGHTLKVWSEKLEKKADKIMKI